MQGREIVGGLGERRIWVRLAGGEESARFEILDGGRSTMQSTKSSDTEQAEMDRRGLHKYEHRTSMFVDRDYVTAQ